MKIYFAGSIRGRRNDKEIYKQIIHYLTNYGEVLTEHIGDNDLTDLGGNHNLDKYIYNRDVEWLKESDVMVAEVTNPSLGVGYEIGKAEELKKYILCLYRVQQDSMLSAMILGNNHIKVLYYNNINEAYLHIDNYFKKICSKSKRNGS